MRSLSGWKATVCFAALVGLLVPGAFASGPETVIDNGTAGGLRPANDQAVESAPSREHFFPRANYVWPYEMGPYYGNLSAKARREPGVLHTTVGMFRLNHGQLAIPDQLKAVNKLGRESAQYFIVQFHPESLTKGRLDSIRASIEASGGKVIRGMEVAAILARLTPDGHAKLQREIGLLALEPYHPAFKLSPQIGRTPLPTLEKANSRKYDLRISVFEGEDSAVIGAKIATLGVDVTGIGSRLIMAQAHQSKLAQVAAIEGIEAVSEALPIRGLAQETTFAVQVGRGPFDASEQAAYNRAGITGVGQLLMVLDSGIQLDAADMSDTDVSAGNAGGGHRKVEFYNTTASIDPVNGGGDNLGCDAPEQGGFTHGQMVTAIAIGNADFTSTAGPNLGLLRDQNDVFWNTQGIAPGARVIAYDAQLTPAVGSCQDPLNDTLAVGQLYPGGTMDDAYTRGARVYNFSWGADDPTYDATLAGQVDDFLENNRNAMVFIAAGNRGDDFDSNGVPDPFGVGNPATSKNGVAVGRHGAPNQFGDQSYIDQRFFTSSVGPVSGSGRIVPTVLAAGGERGGVVTGINSEWSCLSTLNTSGGPVECQLRSNIGGTSMASAAAAGAALLIRDYYGLGFYPDGTDQNLGNGTDVISDVSGALVKATVIASARFVCGPYSFGAGGGLPGGGDNCSDTVIGRKRFNNEQGYGAVQMDNVLPLESWPDAPTGIVIGDVGFPGGRNDTGMTVVDMTVAAEDVQTYTFEVCDAAQELRIALAWVEEEGDALVNDLDLQVDSPSGIRYDGNRYTDDDNLDGAIDPVTEDCPTLFPDGTPGDNGLDVSKWAIQACVRGNATRPAKDSANPSEVVILSPNPDENFDPDTGEPIIDDGFSQIETNGVYTVTVSKRAGEIGSNSGQPFALFIAGGLCSQSSVQLDKTTYVCNDPAVLTVNEFSETGDANPNGGDISSRTTIEVFDAGNVLRDTESGFGFTKSDPNALQFKSDDIVLTANTVRDTGNGVLDVRDGDRVVVTYVDVDSGGVSDPTKTRKSAALVNCKALVASGGVAFLQLGQDTSSQVLGGCELNARGQFEFGFPDRYMDEDELIDYQFGFASNDAVDLDNVSLELRCVYADADSPPTCTPGSTGQCGDPDRTNNSTCDGTTTGTNPMGTALMTILDTPKVIGLLPANSVTSANFSVAMASSITGTHKVDMLLIVKGEVSGKPAESVMADRQNVNVDPTTTLYNTDYAGGGVSVVFDRNNNGFVDQPTSVVGDPSLRLDYQFESRTYSSIFVGVDAGGGVDNNRNLFLSASLPWNFDNNPGGFTSGLAAGSDDNPTITDTIAQWGEDKNFNDLLDGRCESNPSQRCTKFPNDQACTGGSLVCENLEDRDPENLPIPLLDQNWSTRGGCGWQTKAPSTCALPRAADGTSIGCYDNDDCNLSPNPNYGCDELLGCGPCNDVGQDYGGIWHSGTIGRFNDPSGNCQFTGTNDGQCQSFETISGTSGDLQWVELLVTPVVEKVNQQEDGDGEPVAVIEITDWGWNSNLDLPDENMIQTWEVDTDTANIEPADIKSDLVFLNSGGGSFGAFSRNNNAQLWGGWPMFAPLDPVTGESVNGTNGNNREGRNGCFFEGSGKILFSEYDVFGLAGPPDDDANEGYCAPDTSVACTLVCQNSTITSCAVNADCSGTCILDGVFGACSNQTDKSCSVDGDCNFGLCQDIGCDGGPCTFTTVTVDEYVTANGPIKNNDIFGWNGPDMRFSTLEDIYGDTGNSFQGSLGLFAVESDDSTEAGGGYGWAVDDMHFEWKEFTLDEDVTDCATNGSCATLAMTSSNEFEANTRVDITVIDSSPSAQNDCELDGSLSGTTDCDGNAVADVVVKCTAESDVAGEIVVLNSVGGGRYTGSVAVSGSYDLPGTVFLTPQPSNASGNPNLQCVYEDWDDGSGGGVDPACPQESIDLGTPCCRNSVDPNQWTRVLATTNVNLTSGSVVVTRTEVVDNGDDDGWADDNETVDLFVELSNKTNTALSGVLATLASNDPNIDCIISPAITVGDLAPQGQPGDTVLVPTPFVFKMGEPNRTGIFDSVTAELVVNISADQFTSPAQPQAVVLEVDLDASGGSGPTAFIETFEGGFGSFTTMHLDENLNPPDSDPLNEEAGLINSDGYRCQYSDPDWEGANSFGTSSGENCYLNPDNGFGTDIDKFFFQITDDRAFGGLQSLYFGEFLDPTLGFTTPFAQLDAIGTTAPINLGWDRVCSVTRTTNCTDAGDCPGGEECVRPRSIFSFKHQVSFADERSVGPCTSPPCAADRGVVNVQLADGGDNPVGDWVKVEPFVNVYDSLNNDNFFNCMFDPIDDGDSEDDFFDPTDPVRRTGPSSTCVPGFVFAYQGDTDTPFATGNIGNASDGPGLAGAAGTGTWVEPQFDLSRFRGRRVRVRFLNTGLKGGSITTWESAFSHNPTGEDDGWFIDDVTVTDALTEAANFAVDEKDNSALPGCGNACNTVSAVISADPTFSGAPGTVIELDATASTSDKCVDGVLQYQFNSGGSILRDWSDNAKLVVAPALTTQYDVAVRCGTDTGCVGGASATVPVDCPTSGAFGGPFDTVFADPPIGPGNCPFVWASAADGAWAVGDDSTVSSYGTGCGTCGTGTLVGASSYTATQSPTSGQYFWYLFRRTGTGTDFCNEIGSWGNTGRDSALGASPPNTP